MSALLLFAMLELPNNLGERLEALRVEETPRIVVVDVAEQKAAFFAGRQPKGIYTVSTGKNGTGQRIGSNRTPLGWHRIKRKIGAGLPLGAIFESREFTGRVWTPPAKDGQERPKEEGETGPAAESDLITSRIFWLEGVEEGVNRGQDAQGNVVDSFQRYIYFHGTNHEEDLGKPASRGCVRMFNADIVALFDLAQEGDLVLIVEKGFFPAKTGEAGDEKSSQTER
ncbi:MAG: L,D-transpeptidase [Verrucomicrobiae bacterium]|nr:L,D-transpeptidase [Verrucomicrobiae bacterium]